MKDNILLAVSAVSIAVLSIGCVNVQYIGKSYPETTNIKAYSSKSKVPEKYSVMGRAVVSAPYSSSKEEMQDKLISKAEDNGADAVLITGYTIVPTGSVVREDQLTDTAPNDAYASDDDSRGNLRRMNQNFEYGYGRIGKGGGRDSRTYKRIIRAQFLKYQK